MTQARLLVVAGPSGAGKSTVGRALASALNVPFVEADDFHSAPAKSMMRAGVSLTDQDRFPWIDRLAKTAGEHLRHGAPVVLACSALTGPVRQRLRSGVPAPVTFFSLQVDKQTLLRRLRGREGHFMPPDLLLSQLRAAESLAEDPSTLVVQGDRDVESIVSDMVTEIRRDSS